jgi:hypothetical protein
MWHVIGVPMHSGKIHWKCFDGGRWDSEVGVKIQFRFISEDTPQRRQIIKEVERRIAENEVPWLVAGRPEWSVYADRLKESFPALQSLTWLKGKARLPPELESDEETVFQHKRHEGVVACYLTPAALRFSFEAIYQSLWVLECEETCKQGTAFALAGVGLVTCHHVLGPRTVAFKVTNVFKKYAVEVIAAEEALDLAIVRVDAPRGAELDARTAPELEQWEEVAVAGFPNYRIGDTGNIVPGRVVGFRPVAGVRRVMVSAAIVAGMSGGPALDGDNFVVGVAVTGADRMEDSGQTEKHGVIPIGALSHLARL